LSKEFQVQLDNHKAGIR